MRPVTTFLNRVISIMALCLLGFGVKAQLPQKVLSNTASTVDVNSNIWQFNDKAIFIHGDSATGNELWISDGTPAGTHIVKDIWPGPGSSNTEPPHEFNGKMYFAANDSAHGLELWASDGTDTGTYMVKDIEPGSASTSGSYAYCNVGNKMFVLDGNLVVTDGTSIGTEKIQFQTATGLYSYRDISNFTAYNGKLYFYASDSSDLHGIFESDGTNAGTRILTHLPFEQILWQSGGYGGMSNVFSYNILIYNGHLYFNAYDTAHVLSIWRSDGTSIGTVPLKYSVPNFGINYIPASIEWNGMLYYIGPDTIGGWGLRRSDGTSGGTASVKYLPGIENLFTFANKLFFVAPDTLGRPCLWSTDGTNAGTAIFHTVMSADPVAAQDPTHLYFFDSNANGSAQLYVTDNLLSNAICLHTFNYATAANLTSYNGKTYFVVSKNGFSDLWESDGTIEGTRALPYPDTSARGNIPISNYHQVLIPTTTGLYFAASYFSNAPFTLHRLNNNIAALGIINAAPHCLNGTNGIATINITGGTPPYTYLWNTTPAQTSATATGLAVKTYFVTITDAANDTVLSAVQITDSNTIHLSFNIKPSCANYDTTGTAEVVPVGGTYPYTYLWNTTPVQTDSVASTLHSGLYQITVTDAANCNISAEQYVNSTPYIAMPGKQLTWPTCASPANGVIRLYDHVEWHLSYVWNTFPVQTGPTATGLLGGAYTVTVTDANLCQRVAIYYLPHTASDSISDTVFTTTPLCFGESNGTASILITHGAAPFVYHWSDLAADTLNSVASFSAGVFTVSITNANRCITLDTFTIAEPANKISDSTAVSNPLCESGSTASAFVTGINGALPYSYQWSSSAADTLNSISNILPGTYTVSISDNNNCLFIDTIIIQTPQPLIASASFTSPLCYGQPVASASVIVSSGTPPYTYLWNTLAADTASSVYNITAGNYSVAIKDANGCRFTDSVTIPETASPISTNVAVRGNSASVNVLGGQPPYTYDWNTIPAQFTDSVTGLQPGVYTVTIHDADQCTATDNVTIISTGITLTANDMQWRLFPIPAKDILYLSSVSKQKASFRIFDAAGKEMEIISFTDDGMLFHFITDKYACGNYLIQIITPEHDPVSKIFVKQ